jgi:SAM-dependent methyltransferase
VADGEAIPMDEGWNHNTFHHPIVLAAVPPGAERALDVGCGEGILSRELARRVPHVSGLDRHRPTLEGAAAVPGSSVAYVEGDLCRHPFVPGSFDLVATIATLHHVDAELGLRQLADLVRPGGALVVVGLARSRPRDWPTDAVGAVESRLRTWRGRAPQREVQAPTVWPPPVSYADMRALASRLLPGVTYRRHRMFRYSLTWTRPGAAITG